MQIQDFIAAAKQKLTGNEDKKLRVGELAPDVEETKDGDNWFLKPNQPTMFQSTGDIWNLTRWSFMQFCKRISPNDAKMDFKYVKACGPQLGLQQLRWWNAVWNEREGFFRLHIDPHTKRTVVRAVLSGLYRPIDAYPVGKHLEKMLDSEQDIEYILTDERWLVQYWISSAAGSKYGVGFRAMGSEVGAMKHLRFDVMIQFHTDKGMIRLPVLLNRAPLCAIPYSGAGSEALNRLDLSIKRGTQAAEEAAESIAQRKLEPLKYAADEFYELCTLQGLPSEMRGLPLEQPKLFEGVKTKFDLSCLLGELASQTTGRSQIKIESAAGVYLLTGRVKSTVNRNDDI